jgi:hypothetical protein
MSAEQLTDNNSLATSPRRVPLWLRRIAATLAPLASIEGGLIFWFAASPLASFYLRFPTDKSIITFDRGLIALVVLLLIAKAWVSPARRAGGVASLRFIATKFEIAWAMVAAVALLSAMFLSNDFTYALKLAIDSFALPLVMFHLARHHFDARGRRGYLLIAAIALAWFLFATGAYEFLTGVNFYPYKGSELMREGERRVNGPFAADSSYAIICLFVFVLLQSAPKLFRLKFDRAARFLFIGALIAAAAGALLPMFRSAAMALVACWLIITFASRRKRAEATDRRSESATTQSAGGANAIPASARPPFPALRLRISASRFRMAAAAIALILFSVISSLALGLVSPGKRLTSSHNVIGRLATWQSAMTITLENPWFGVGLTNYQWAFDQRYFYSDQEADTLLDTSAVNSPHSNLLSVAAEMGVIALLFYVVANAYLFLLGWGALRRAQTMKARAAAAGCLALFVAYWLPGLTLVSGYYSDANLYFFFLTGLLSNDSLTSDF